MAKRTRYPNRLSTRPARRPTRPDRPSSPAAAIPAAPEPAEDFEDEAPLRSSGHLTDEEIRRAAALEAEATTRDRAAIAASLRQRQGAQVDGRAPLVDVNAPLAVRAAREYAYVARDVRRIIVTASLMIGLLAILFVAINVLGLLKG